MELVRRQLMQPLQEVLVSLPLPWRVTLILVPFVLVAFLLLPKLLSLTGLAISWALRFLINLYAWGEYHIIRLVRRYGRQPGALLGFFDDRAEAVALTGGRRALAVGGNRVILRTIRTTIFALAVLPLVCWYLAPKAEPGTAVRTRLMQGVTWSASFDAWVRTGTWPQPREKKPVGKPKPRSPKKR